MPKLTLSLNTIIQTLSTIAQFITQYGTDVPEKYRIYVTSALAVLQGVTAILAHLRNTNGTVTAKVAPDVVAVTVVPPALPPG